MYLSDKFSLPFTDPVLIFSLVLFIILLAPILLRKFRIPSIVGLILAGVAIGPHGFNLLMRDSSIVLFGTVGLLYIMFLAGLQMDISDFKRNRNRSFAFGLLTFSIPFILGTLVSNQLLGYSLSTSILLASMFSTHTLVSYPIASRLGIIRNPAVAVTVGGTIITDTAALLALTLIVNSSQGELTLDYILRLGITFIGFILLVVFGFSKLAGWFFRSVKGEGSMQYIFVLAVVFSAAFCAQLAGVEPIIGAFLAGIALNRVIPHTTPLMNRIEFIGNTLFIPFFLIGVGMIIDLRVLFRGEEALIVAGTLTATAMLSKYLAAFFTQKIFDFSLIQRHIIFGLSNSHAAATLAIIMIGFNIGMVNEDVLNGTIILILVTCLVSSFVTETTGRKLAITETVEKKPETLRLPERILVPLSNPAAIEVLLQFALLVKNPSSHEPLYVMSVAKDDTEALNQIKLNNSALEKALHNNSVSANVEVISRVDLNAASGIVSAMRELIITEVIIGWNPKTSATDVFFGTVLDNLIGKTDQMFTVCKIVQPVNTFKKIVAVAPANSQYEKGFSRWIKTVSVIARQIPCEINFFGDEQTIAYLKINVSPDEKAQKISYSNFEKWEDFATLRNKTGFDTLFVVISARGRTISHNTYLDKVPGQLSEFFDDRSFLLIYPEQYDIDHYDSSVLRFDGLTVSPIKENMERINKLGKMFRQVIAPSPSSRSDKFQGG